MAQAVAARSPADLIRAELERVEETLRESAASEVPALHEAACHILGAGGKRLRPQLVLLASGVVGGRSERAIPLAAACELIHTATLVHDDIVDGSESRRGRASVQRYFGNSASVLMGDYLVVRAFELIARDPEQRLWSLLAATIARMCEGEVLQIGVRRDVSISLDVYETIVACKTALLMASCTRFGGLAGGASADEEDALTRFGHSLGMAFQIQDDILDFVGAPETLGKPTGGDLREGKVTLPVLFALESAGAADREELRRLYEGGEPAGAREIRRAAEIIELTGGFDRARHHALGYVRRAREALHRLPPGEARDALEGVADHVVDRSK